MNKDTNTEPCETVEYIKPSPTCYTIYSKSDCKNCTKVKEILQSHKIQIVIVNCDDYLLTNKAGFLEFIMNLISMEWKTFPIVFDNGKFIGGFVDTKIYLEQTLEFTEEF